MSYRNKEQQPPCNYSVSQQALNIFIIQSYSSEMSENEKQEEGEKEVRKEVAGGRRKKKTCRTWWAFWTLSACAGGELDKYSCHVVVNMGIIQSSLSSRNNQSRNRAHGFLNTDICRKEARPLWSRTLSGREKITSVWQRKRQAGPDAGWVIETAYCCSVTFTKT